MTVPREMVVHIFLDQFGKTTKSARRSLIHHELEANERIFTADILYSVFLFNMSFMRVFSFLHTSPHFMHGQYVVGMFGMTWDQESSQSFNDAVAHAETLGQHMFRTRLPKNSRGSARLSSYSARLSPS